MRPRRSLCIWDLKRHLGDLNRSMPIWDIKRDLETSISCFLLSLIPCALPSLFFFLTFSAAAAAYKTSYLFSTRGRMPMFLLISPVATPSFPCSRFLSTTALFSLVVSCFSPKETNIIRTRYGSALFSSLCFLHYFWSYFVLLLASGSVLMLSLSSSLLFSVEMKALFFAPQCFFC